MLERVGIFSSGMASPISDIFERIDGFVCSFKHTLPISAFFAESVVPPPSENNLRLFEQPNFDSKVDFSAIGIPEWDLCYIRRINASGDREREKYFGEMLQDCQSKRIPPSGLATMKSQIKSWKKEALQVCLLAFEIVLQLFRCGLDRAAAHHQHQSLFRDAANSWILECFRLWTFPLYEPDTETRYINCAFKSAWEAFKNPILATWFNTMIGVCIALRKGEGEGEDQ